MADGEVKVRFISEGAEQLHNQLKQSFDMLGQLRDAFRQGAVAAEGLGGATQLLSGALSAAATPVGALTIAFGALVAVFEKAAGTAENVFRQVRQLSATTGLGVEDTKALTDAFKLMGLESGSLDRAMFRLSAELDSGGKRIASLGVAALDASGNLRPTGEVFIELVRKLSQVGDAAQRNAMLVQLFGRAGRELAPVFAQGGASLDDFMRKAKELGVFTEQDAAQSRAFVQAKAELAKRSEELWLSVSRVAVPVLTAVVNAIILAKDAIGAFVRLGTQMFSQIPSWAQYFIPIIGQMKLFAQLAHGVEGFINRLRGIGPAAPAAAPAAGAAPAERIETSEDVRFQMKMNEERLRLEERYVMERTRLETGSQAESIRQAEAFLEQRLALEREGVQKILALTPDPLQREKVQREAQQKEIQLEGERRLLLLKEREAESADAKRVLDDRLKAEKLAGDEASAIQRVRREEQLQALEQLGLSEEEISQKRLRIETQSSQQTLELRKSTIDSEIAGLQELAEHFKDNAALQRETQLRIMELTHQRTMAEIEAVSQVDRARADAAKRDEERQQKAAGALGELIRLAESYARMQGRTTITREDISQAFTAAQSGATQIMGTFFAGGGVTAEALQQAQQFQQLAGTLRQIGVTPGEAVTAGAVQSFRALGPDFLEAYGAATPYPQVAAGLRGASSGYRSRDIDATMDAVSRAGDAAIDQVLGRIPVIMDDMFERFTDGLIRKLEFEAARQ